MKHDWELVEKKNHLAVHGLFMSRTSAEKHLAETIPEYCRKGFFMDKTLKPEDFEVIGPSLKLRGLDWSNRNEPLNE